MSFLSRDSINIFCSVNIIDHVIVLSVQDGAQPVDRKGKQKFFLRSVNSLNKV